MVLSPYYINMLSSLNETGLILAWHVPVGWGVFAPLEHIDPWCCFVAILFFLGCISSHVSNTSLSTLKLLFLSTQEHSEKTWGYKARLHQTGLQVPGVHLIHSLTLFYYPYCIAEFSVDKVSCPLKSWITNGGGGVFGKIVGDPDLGNRSLK